MIADELVYENDFVVDGCRKSIGLCKKVIFGVVLDGSNERRLCVWGQICDFLEVTRKRQGYVRSRCKPKFACKSFVGKDEV